MSKHRDLNVRQHARAQIELPAELHVAPEHQPQVRLTGECETARGPHALSFRLVDLGAGGAGGHSVIYVPRLVRAVLMIYDPGECPESPTPLFEHEVRVRRCELIGPEPTYLLGFSFENADPSLADRIAETLERATVYCAPHVPSDPNDAGGFASA